MSGTISLVSVALGAAIAFVADRVPAKRDLLETSAGVLLIGGLALLGLALPALL